MCVLGSFSAERPCAIVLQMKSIETKRSIPGPESEKIPLHMDERNMAHSGVKSITYKTEVLIIHHIPKDISRYVNQNTCAIMA